MCAEIYRGPKILFVDEDQEMRLFFAVEIEKLGLKVTAAPTGIQARACLRSQKFDLIITEYKLKDGDGFDLFCYVQKNHPKVKFLFFTDEQMDQNIFEAPNFIGILSKSNPKSLLGFLENFRNTYRKK